MLLAAHMSRNRLQNHSLVWEVRTYCSIDEVYYECVIKSLWCECQHSCHLSLELQVALLWAIHPVGRIPVMALSANLAVRPAALLYLPGGQVLTDRVPVRPELDLLILSIIVD